MTVVLDFLLILKSIPLCKVRAGDEHEALITVVVTKLIGSMVKDQKNTRDTDIPLIKTGLFVIGVYI